MNEWTKGKKQALSVIVVILLAAVSVYAVVKTGNLPLTIEETNEIPAGGELVFKAPTNSPATALKVKVDLDVLTNLVQGVTLEGECWVIIGAEPEAAGVAGMRRVQ
jgi:hypothetical protein